MKIVFIIKRKDGLYYTEDATSAGFQKLMPLSKFFLRKETANKYIKLNKLKDCKVVVIKIGELEDEN